VEEPLLSFSDVVGVSQEGVLDGHFPVSFELKPGEIGIIRSGPKAAALIRLAALRGIVVKGTVTVLGTTVRAEDDPARYLSHHFTKKFRSSLGFAHNHGGLIANMSILQNVMLPAHYHSGLRAFKPFYESAKVQLKEAGFPEELWGHRPCDVPYDLQKRALLARSINHDPKILILEEPTNSIPWSQLYEIADWIRKQKEKGKGILIATGNDPFAGLVGDWMVDLIHSVKVCDAGEIRRHLGNLVSKGTALLRKQGGAGNCHAK
jgi:ABC-type transporter Mla maintaining outer membrane lipid asymmetry ATPase subunit MlaF